MQRHYKTFKERLEKFPCNVEYIQRFKSTQQIKRNVAAVEKGETDILIGHPPDSKQRRKV